MRRIDVKKYCDIVLSPKKNRIDIIVRVLNEPIDTVFDASLQEGFPGWSSDFFEIEKWVWGFVDLELVEHTFKEKALIWSEKLKDKKVKAYSDEWKIKIFLTRLLKGKNKLSKTTKKKISKALKSAVNKTKFKKGHQLSEYTRRKISSTHTGMKRSKEHREAISRSLRGRKLSKETIEKLKKNANQPKGEKHHKAVLTKEKVLLLVEMKRTGNYSQQQLADYFGISKSAVKSILNGNSWREVTGIVKGEFKTEPKLTPEKVLEIVRLYNTGKYTHKQLADMFNIDKSSVSRILSGESWSHVTGIVKKEKKPVLTKEDVLKMVEMYNSGKYTKKELESIFNVSRATVSRIFRGLIWSEVTGIKPKKVKAED